jgi:predicted metal-dependent hydrolase
MVTIVKPEPDRGNYGKLITTPTGGALSFADWILTHKEQQTAYGDLARDIAADMRIPADVREGPKIPTGSTARAWRNYLEEHGASYRALQVLEDAHDEYKTYRDLVILQKLNSKTARARARSQDTATEFLETYSRMMTTLLEEHHTTEEILSALVTVARWNLRGIAAWSGNASTTELAHLTDSLVWCQQTATQLQSSLEELQSVLTTALDTATLTDTVRLEQQ